MNKNVKELLTEWTCRREKESRKIPVSSLTECTNPANVQGAQDYDLHLALTLQIKVI